MARSGDCSCVAFMLESPWFVQHVLTLVWCTIVRSIPISELANPSFTSAIAADTKLSIWTSLTLIISKDWLLYSIKAWI